MNVDLIEKAAEIVGDNQLLVNIVSKRVHQLSHGSDPFVPTTPEMGSGDIALTEIIRGKLQWREMTQEEVLAAAEVSAAEVSELEASLAAAPEDPELITITAQL